MVLFRSSILIKDLYIHTQTICTCGHKLRYSVVYNDTQRYECKGQARYRRQQKKKILRHQGSGIIEPVLQ